MNVRNNLFDDINSNWGASNGLFLAAPATDGLVFEHNTATSNVQTKGLFVADQGTGAGFVFRSNIGPRGSIGVKGSGLGEGTATLNALFPGWKFTANVIFGAGGSCVFVSIRHLYAVNCAGCRLPQQHSLGAYFHQPIQQHRPRWS